MIRCLALQGVEISMFERGVEELGRRYPGATWTVIGEGRAIGGSLVWKIIEAFRTARRFQRDRFDRCVIVGFPSTSVVAQFLAWRLAIPQVIFLDPDRWQESSYSRRRLWIFLAGRAIGGIFSTAIGAIEAAGLVLLVSLNLLVALGVVVVVEGLAWGSRNRR